MKDYMAGHVANDNRAHAVIGFQRRTTYDNRGEIWTIFDSLCGKRMSYRLSNTQAERRERCQECEDTAPGFLFWRD